MIAETTNPVQPPLNLDQEVDLLEYLDALLRAKYRILILAVLIAGAVYGYAKLKPDIFRSTAVVAFNIPKNMGGVSAASYRGSDLFSMIERDYAVDDIADNERERMIAKIYSTDFLKLFIEKTKLLHYIFASKWDAERTDWSDGFKPSILEATSIVRDGMLSAEIDAKTDLLKITFTTKSAELSAQLSNTLYQLFNDYIKEEKLAELAARSELLNARLTESSNVEMQRSIYRMLEVRLAEEALLKSKRNYPLEVIEVAQIPMYKSGPSRKLWAILGFVLTAILGVVVTFGMVLLKKLRAALRAYQPAQSPVIKEDSRDSAEVENPKTRTAVQMVSEEPKVNRDSPLDSLDDWVDRPS